MLHNLADAIIPVTNLVNQAMNGDFQQCGMCDEQRLRPACAYAQTDQSLCKSLEYSLNIKLLTEHHLELVSLKGSCTGSFESTVVKMPHCWKSRDPAQLKLQSSRRLQLTFVFINIAHK